MGMTLRYDRQISTKLLAAAWLLRRAEDDSVASTLPKAHAAAAETEAELEVIVAYIDIKNGHPVELAAGVSPMGDDEPPTSAYAFAVEIPAGNGSVSDRAVLDAIAESIRELTHVYELQEKA